MKDFRVRLQLAEAFGPVNRWFCSRAYGYQIDDEHLLLTHFIRSGGAKDFAERYEQATGPVNRWYCSEFHGHEISDPQILWEYYTTHTAIRAADDICDRPPTPLLPN
jgi:hypothetical protein